LEGSDDVKDAIAGYLAEAGIAAVLGLALYGGLSIVHNLTSPPRIDRCNGHIETVGKERACAFRGGAK